MAPAFAEDQRISRFLPGHLMSIYYHQGLPDGLCVDLADRPEGPDDSPWAPGSAALPGLAPGTDGRRNMRGYALEVGRVAPEAPDCGLCRLGAGFALLGQRLQEAIANGRPQPWA